ncbi:hypothetical protein YE3148 [Yersinia enterocolitica subsp. enterocolitica 8081]|uniref:Uncharacterized protein n=1 Tax=Yersinia enterocolitica serotype O:8 / biotype 1B (strain NCTC 13174 / 8081) TaxID=393305 RepID=A1JNQ8_YERE8|nr:hypothetical protein YE3148 [Yersinia enterocolitica subsp. enterocolitica 8081]
MCVGRAQSPQSLTDVRSWGFTRLPPSCNSNYLGYNQSITLRNKQYAFRLHQGGLNENYCAWLRSSRAVMVISALPAGSRCARLASCATALLFS